MDASPLRRALSALANRQSLSDNQTAEVFGIVMSGEATPAQIGGLLMGLRAKGETADELAGAARALREAGAAEVHAVFVHAVMAPGALSKIRSAGVQRVAASDSVVAAQPGELEIIDIAPLLARAVAGLVRPV